MSRLLEQEVSLQDLWKEGRKKQGDFVTFSQKRPLNLGWIVVRQPDCPTWGAHKLASLAGMGGFGKEGMATRTSVCAELFSKGLLQDPGWIWPLCFL